MKAKLSVIVILLILGGSLRVGDTAASSETPSTQCRIGQQAPPIGFWMWAANARVRVYVVKADFTAEQLPYLLGALDSWNGVSEGTGSGVVFNYQGNAQDELSCENCLTIKRGSVFDKTRRHVTELRAFSVHRDQIINYAAIVVDSKLTNPKALGDALAHEIGHNLGLLDCYTCKQKSTVMNQLREINVPNEMAAPTLCDVAQVREAYKELRVHIRPSPTNRGLIDEGEEPVDDDTPIVIPKPDKPQ
jgi:hypothetical protein